MASWVVSWVVWSLRWRFPEADPEMGIHVQVIINEVSLGERTEEGTRTGKGAKQESGKVPKRTGTLEGSVCLKVVLTHPGQGSWAFMFSYSKALLKGH